MDRTEIMRRVHEGYAARRRGDVEAIMTMFHPEGSFQLAGSAELTPAAMAIQGEPSLRAAMQGLVDGFEFIETHETDSIVEGLSAAIRWRARVRYRPTAREAETEMFELWRFAPDGRIMSLTQFADTALICKLMG